MTAADLLGIKRTKAYTLARNGAFPVPTVRIGRSYRVAVASIVELFGLGREPRT
ncbi:helix-turn-helix domain-containing protein [Amycolatopsis sp. OK19-0408]|uniref:Helix-turn-helix domain-containing protein n=1 Tax=Amycolatopsis iheyensis TaxID=2945988 RepID=A0A9X2NIC5_9PSEU|nr:helix-turn-helix domain-containing protein [Amycolatopsis iheyensis]MCR6488322.1 helix-turn-helix domain-containing protein [Amycolatopsis iheyensis]